MMLKILFAALVVCVVDASPLDKRQGFLGSLAGAFMKSKAPVSTKNIEPQFNKNAVRQIIRWGPYKLLAANATRPSGFRLDPNGDGFNEIYDGICRDCMILSGSTYLTYKNESLADVASGVYNHHVFVADMGKTSKNFFSCGGRASLPPGVSAAIPGMSSPKGSPKGSTSASGPMAGHGMMKRQVGSMPGMSQIFGSGDDGAAIQYAVKGQDNKVGFYIGPKETIFQSSEFINYRREDQEVYITFDIEFMKGKPPGWRDAMMGAMAATGCGGIAFNPPAGKATTLKSPAYTVTADGTIFNAQAHLHDGGVNVRLLLNGKLACDSVAHYGGEKGTTTVGGEKWETIQNYERCKPIDVKKGDQIVIESTYDLATHKLRPGAIDHSMGAEAMAMMGYVFAEKM